jgi:PAS domain S-box-containing protein
MGAQPDTGWGPVCVGTDIPPDIEHGGAARYVAHDARPVSVALDEDDVEPLAQTGAQLVWTMPRGGAIVAPIPEWSAYTGEPLDALRESEGSAALHPEDRDRVRRLVADAVAGGVTYSAECRMRRRDGIYQWFLLHGVPMRSGRRISQWICTLTNITDYKWAQGARLQGEVAGLRGILDVLPVGVALVDITGRITLANAAMRELWGEELARGSRFGVDAGRKAWWPGGEALVPEDFAAARALRRDLVVPSEELEIERADGLHKTVLQSAAPVHDAGGGLVGAVTVMMDVSDHTWLEREAAALGRELTAIMDAMMDGVAIYSADGHMLHVNKAGRALFGDAMPGERSPCEQPGCPDTANLRDEQGRPFTAETWPLTRLLRGEAEADAEITDMAQLRADGATRHYNLAGTALRAPDGRITGAVAVARDVTERHRLEETLREANARLTQASREATARAEELATINAHMDQLLRMVNHELKTPLATLKGHLQLAERRLKRGAARDGKGPGEDATRERIIESVLGLLERSQQQVARMTRMVNDLVDTSRIQDSGLDLRLAPCKLASVVREIVREQKLAAPERTIRLVLPVGASPQVHADPVRIGQVVANYLANAIRYSPPERPIEVHLTIEGTHARLAVRDQGPGLPPGEHTRIWERFYRGQSVLASDASGMGLGLGLYISKTIIEQHQGQVGVESVAGEGATFWFTLPLLRS